MNEKITAEEVQLLRNAAEKERETHAKVMKDIEALNGRMYPSSSNYVAKIKMTEKRQMEIVSRKRESEVLALLQAFSKKTGDDPTNNLSDEVQLFIYDAANKLFKAKKYMLKNNILCYAVEKRIFDEDMPLYLDEDGKQDKYPKFSPEGEVYIAKQTLEKCKSVERISIELIFLNEYTQTYSLSVPGEVALMDFLFVTPDHNNVIKTLEDFVRKYIVHYEELSPDAQIRLIQSGNHELIMYYITHSKNGFDDGTVAEKLIERGNREEVTAYFKRYGREE